jgi:hypothetical protein
MDRELPLRIVVIAPPKGVTFRVQRGKSELVPPSVVSADSISFELSVRVRRGNDGSPNFLGPYAQGPPRARFIYVNSGTLAGDPGSCWTRRTKVHLAGISLALIESTLDAKGGVVAAQIAGKGRDGGPACATVPLLDGGWKVVIPS